VSGDARGLPLLGPGLRVFRRWSDKGLVKEFHDRLRGKAREAADRDPEPTAGIIDSQSVKAAACVPASSRGFAAERRSTAVSGTS